MYIEIHVAKERVSVRDAMVVKEYCTEWRTGVAHPEFQTTRAW